jgi:2-aminoadipate transaminase
VPGEAAFLDGRGRNAMRLNFSGSDEDAIREGIRRIGEVVTEQVQLYGTLTGELEAVKLPEEPAPVEIDEPLPRGADILQMPDRSERARRAGF